MDEKESVPLLATHSRYGKAASRRRPAGRRSAWIMAIVALATSTLLLFLSTTGGFCHHLRPSPVSLSSSIAENGTHRWPVSSGALSDDRPVVAGTPGVGGNDRGDAPSAGSFSNRAESGVGTPVVLRRQSTSVTTTSATATSTVLEDFEVHQPVLTPSGATLDDGQSTQDSSSVEAACSVVLMDHVFAYSYGEPYIGNYTPPDCEFNRVAMNFTVVSEGRQ